METISRNNKRAVLLLSSLLAASLSAQTAATSKSDQVASDEVVHLSPFAVTTDQDSGYKASNSIGGTRSNTPIKDIPLNLQVFTKDLSDDLIIADQTSLERYNAALTNGGADVQSENNIQQAYNAFLFRGFVQNWGLRDGVREYDPVDAQGLARVEVVKGPAAALYGVTYAGGVMNSITKTVDMTRNFASIRFTGYDEGGYRATIDANYTGKAGDGKFGVRFNGANSVSEDKRDHSQGNSHYTQTNLEYRPLAGTEIKFLAEQGERQKPNGLGYYTYTPTAADIAKNPSLASNGDASIPLQVAHPEIPWTWNWANSSNVRSLQTALYRGSIDQAIGENFHINAYLQVMQRDQSDGNGWDDGNNSQNAAGWDVNSNLATGWVRNADGTEFIRKAFHSRSWNNRDHALGATGVYKFEVVETKNTITAGGANWDERFFSLNGNQTTLTSVNGGLPVATPDSMLYILPIAANIDTSAKATPSNYVAFQDAGREHSQNRYYFASWQLSALDNRLKLNAGANHTIIKDLSWGGGATDHGPLTNVSKTSPMFGGMFDITKDISVFAVHATSLFPTTDKNDFDVQMPPVVGKSNEVGVKTELLNGMISGTISYYQITQTGGDSRDPSAVNRNKLLWDTLTPAQRLTIFPNFGSRDLLQDRSGNLGDLVPAGEQKSKGLEADFVFQPIKSLQIVLSYANNDEKVTKESIVRGVPVFFPAVTAAPASTSTTTTTTTTGNTTSTVTSTTTTPAVAAAAAYYQTDLGQSTVGQSTSGHVKSQFSLLTKYTFLEGAAKGLSLGIGLQSADKALQGYDDTPVTVNTGNVTAPNGALVANMVTTHNYTARYNPSTFYAEIFAGYKFKAFGLNQVVQFNAKNLTKQDDFIGWVPSGKAGVVSTERYKVPTYARYSLTWGLDF
jgi:outer membrane receptor protein involved in Fe transport